MYRFADKDHATVTNLITGLSGIHPGIQAWEEYQKFVDAGGITEPFDTRSPSEVLNDTKAEMWGKIKAERSRRMDGGFKVEIEPGVFKWYNSDSVSRTQHLGLLLAGAAIPPIEWKTMDGTFVPMSQAVITKVFQAALLLDAALFARAEQHKAAMEASADPANYDFSTGWPENFYGL